MFDFLRWRQFLSDRASALEADGFTVDLCLSDHSPKPGTSLDIRGQKVLASFASWNTGETDYELFDDNGDPKARAWGLLLNDENFQTAFEQFSNELRKIEFD